MIENEAKKLYNIYIKRIRSDFRSELEAKLWRKVTEEEKNKKGFPFF